MCKKWLVGTCPAALSGLSAKNTVDGATPLSVIAPLPKLSPFAV